MSQPADTSYRPSPTPPASTAPATVLQQIRVMFSSRKIPVPVAPMSLMGATVETTSGENHADADADADADEGSQPRKRKEAPSWTSPPSSVHTKKSKLQSHPSSSQDSFGTFLPVPFGPSPYLPNSGRPIVRNVDANKRRQLSSLPSLGNKRRQGPPAEEQSDIYDEGSENLPPQKPSVYDFPSDDISSDGLSAPIILGPNGTPGGFVAFAKKRTRTPAQNTARPSISDMSGSSQKKRPVPPQTVKDENPTSPFLATKTSTSLRNGMMDVEQDEDLEEAEAEARDDDDDDYYAQDKGETKTRHAFSHFIGHQVVGDAAVVMQVRWKNSAKTTFEPEQLMQEDYPNALYKYWTNKKGGRSVIFGKKKEADHTFFVFKILAHRATKLKGGGKGTLLQVHWVGYPASDFTWEPEAKVEDIAPKEYQAYWDGKGGKAVKRGRGRGRGRGPSKAKKAKGKKA